MSTTEPKNRKPAAERRYSREHNNQHRTQLFSAVVLILVGCLLLLGGFYAPPLGVIDSSLLIAFGEILTFVGALFGIDYHYKFKDHLRGNE